MKLKKKNIAVGTIIIGVIAFCAYSAYLKPDLLNFLPSSVTNVFTDKNSENTSAIGNDSGQGADQDSKNVPKKIYGMGESVPFIMDHQATIKGAKLTGIVNTTAVSKQIPEIFKDSNIDYFNGEETDSSKTLTSPHSYVTINLTLTLDSAEPCNVCIYFYLLPLDENNKVMENVVSSDMMAYDKGPKIQSKDYFFVNLQPQQEITYNLLYILKDEDLNYRLCLNADCSGSTEYSDINFIELQFEKNKF